MKYKEWLNILHPQTRSFYERSVAGMYGRNTPDVIVFINTVRRDSPEGKEVIKWLDDHVGWHTWYLVDHEHGSSMNIIGFDEEDMDKAVEFKLRYGSGYDPINNPLV